MVEDRRFNNARVQGQLALDVFEVRDCLDGSCYQQAQHIWDTRKYVKELLVVTHLLSDRNIDTVDVANTNSLNLTITGQC